jgi:hypothetical protein
LHVARRNQLPERLHEHHPSRPQPAGTTTISTQIISFWPVRRLEGEGLVTT